MFWKKKPLPEILFLLIISAIVYLPHIGNLTYYKDDWYYIYDGMLGGAKIFQEMFRIDRPARGFFFRVVFFSVWREAFAVAFGGIRLAGLGCHRGVVDFQHPLERKPKIQFHCRLALCNLSGLLLVD